MHPAAAHGAHQFRVHARDVDAHHARVVEESSFEAAAVAYVEDFASRRADQRRPRDQRHRPRGAHRA